MPKLNAEDLVKEVSRLDQNRYYDYVSGTTKVKYIEITPPMGPIRFVRMNTKTGTEGQNYNISTNKLVEAARAFSSAPNHPIHFDTLFGSAGNDRTALETLLLYTPHFFYCRRDGKKHIMWCPDKEHPLGTKMEERCPDVEETESPEGEATHRQVQANLVEIGRIFNCLCWIAKGDRSKTVGKTRLGDLEGVLPSLDQAKVFWDSNTRDAALQIDCIWFMKDWKHIPAIFEVEHSTSVKSGLDRMVDLHNTMPSFRTQYIIVAPDHRRTKVVREANKLSKRVLQARFMPYSSLEQLYQRATTQNHTLMDADIDALLRFFSEEVVKK